MQLVTILYSVEINSLDDRILIKNKTVMMNLIFFRIICEDFQVGLTIFFPSLTEILLGCQQVVACLPLDKGNTSSMRRSTTIEDQLNQQ